MYGWSGTTLRVELTGGKTIKQPLDEQAARNFIGGRGLNSMTLFEEIKPGIDPLYHDNILCLATGPLTGTRLGLCSRLEVSTLSPLSGILGDGNAGGFFATFLKRAGYDQVVITGRASSPQYLWIDDEHVELKDASHLWGHTIWETTDVIKKTHGKDVWVAGIGQAGENLVRFATTMVDNYSSAAPGSGAVFGSKNLKAIAVRGTGKVDLAMPEEFEELVREDKEYFLRDRMQREVIGVYGSHMGMLWWRPGYRYFERSLSPDEVPECLKPEAWKRYEIRRTACWGCVVRCKNFYQIPVGSRAGELGSGLEFHAIADLGTNCGIEDPVTIMEMANLGDAYGMDHIALGHVIGFAKKLYHLGIITKEDTGGLSLEWTDSEAQVELIHRVALREGFGNLIAEGLYNFAKIIGRGAMDYCYHVKGISRGVYPPGLFALAHATGTRGADHLRGRSLAHGRHDPDLFPTLLEKGILPHDMVKNPGKWLIILERATTLADAIGRCKGSVNSWACTVPLIWKYPLWNGIAKLLNTATGFEFDSTRLEEAADRIYTLEMAFNARQGITRNHDRLPQRPDLGATDREKESKRHAEMLTEYYQVHGCDVESGIPSRGRLEHLGLKYVADEFKAHGPYPQWEGPTLWSLDEYPRGGVRPKAITKL